MELQIFIIITIINSGMKLTDTHHNHYGKIPPWWEKFMVGMRWVTMIMTIMITWMMILMMMINSQVDGICFDVLDLMNTTQRRWGSEHYG